MLSDEEREALEILNNTEWNGFMITIKNLIKKQSKEIEELKEITNSYNSYGGNLMNDTRIIICDSRYFLNGTFVNKFVSKDKIKAKIEEVDYKMIAHQDVREAVKQVLNSLLEKE